MLSGNLTRHELEQKVEDWAFLRTKSKLRFDAVEALTLLQELGLVRENPDRQVRLPQLHSS